MIAFCKSSVTCAWVQKSMLFYFKTEIIFQKVDIRYPKYCIGRLITNSMYFLSSLKPATFQTPCNLRHLDVCLCYRSLLFYLTEDLSVKLTPLFSLLLFVFKVKFLIFSLKHVKYKNIDKY